MQGHGLLQSWVGECVQGLTLPWSPAPSWPRELGVELVHVLREHQPAVVVRCVAAGGCREPRCQVLVTEQGRSKIIW